MKSNPTILPEKNIIKHGQQKKKNFNTIDKNRTYIQVQILKNVYKQKKLNINNIKTNNKETKYVNNNNRKHTRKKL